MKKNTFYNVLNNPFAKVALATSILVSTGVSAATPILTAVTQEAEAAAKSETIKFSDSLNRNQSQTITLPNNAKIKNITTNTGSVTYSQNGNQLTVNVKDGASTKEVANPTKYSKQASNSLTSGTNSFSGSNSYSDAEGYSGTLSKSGSASVISGSYTPPDSKTVTDSITSTSNSFEAGKTYNAGGYYGTLSKNGAVTSQRVLTGYENVRKSEWVESGRWENTGYYKQVRRSTCEGWTYDAPCYADYYYENVWVTTGQQWVVTGGSWQYYYDSEPVYATQYTQNYSGTVTKPSVDTRTWSQNYSGTVYKAGKDQMYGYEVKVEYTTDETPPSINLSVSNTSPTNQDVSIKAVITDTESSISSQKWAYGSQAASYFATGGTNIANGTFIANKNGVYTVYASDSEGNEAVRTIEVANIDKTPPGLATLALNNTKPTNKDVIVSIAFPSDAAKKEYSFDGTVWNLYKEDLTLSTNGSVFARSFDNVGNQSQTASLEVNNIDKINPTIDSVTLVNNYVSIATSDNHAGIASIEVKVGNEPYTSYKENTLKIMQNSKITVRVTDKASNISEKSFDLVNDAYYQELLAQITLVADQLQIGGQNKATLNQMKQSLENILKDANNLVVDSEKTDIIKKANDLIAQIQALLDALDKAQVELEDIGDTPSQIELDKAKEVIEALPPSPEKDKLLEELEKKQNQKDLDDAKKLVDELGDNPTQAEIDHVREIVEDLVDSEGKTELLDIIKDKQINLDKLIEEATKAVEELNDRSTPEEVNHAKDLINKLPKGPEKDALLEKLKEKEQAIKDRLTLDELLKRAEEAVKHAETYPTKFNIELAEKAVKVLPDITEKTALLDRIEKIKDNLQLEEAKKKVEQAERYERDPYLADAIKLVDALKESDNKQSLKDRLQAILDKLKEKQELEDKNKGNDGQFDPTNPDRSIEDAINTIQDPEANKFFTKWHKANNNASKFFSRAMTANAVKVKGELPASYSSKASYANLIQELTTRTNNLALAWEEASKDKVTEQLFSKAYTLVDLYEASKSERNYKNALAAIKALPDGVAKTGIEAQLASLKNHKEDETSVPTLNSKETIEQAEKAVANYEKYKSSYYQKKALEAVDSLIDSDEKTAFQERLSVLNK